MKYKLMCIVIMCLLLVIPNEVKAHPGKTNADGCHYCRTNCAKWGLSDGEYHCHNGENQNSSNSTNSSNQSTIQTKPKKSSDNTLKSVIVDGTTITVADKMQYETNKDKVSIFVETNDDKAESTVNNKSLDIGENDIKINVKAEDGSEKIYTLTVNRLSNNTNIKIIVDGKEVTFINNKADVTVSSDTIKLNYKYELEDPKAKVEITGDEKLKAGDNIVKFKVIAEDGTEKEYELTVEKYTKTEEMVNGVISIGVIGGIGYGVYHTVKKKQK